MTDYEGVTFPLDSFKEAAIHLRRPFTPQAVKFKVQNEFGQESALIAPYIDARLVVERFNLILPHLWSDEFAAVDGNTLRCALTVDGITRYDVGVGQGQQAAKTCYSDSLKRAAVKFGVGVSLYAIPKIFLKVDAKKWLELKGQQKKRLVITDAGDAALRNGYEKWLDEHGEEAFGPALNHGDVEVSVGDPDVDDTVPESDEQESAGALIEGEVADELRRKCRDTYAAITDLEGRAKFPAGAFQAGLESAGDSVEGLEGYLAELQARLEKNREKAPVAS